MFDVKLKQTPKASLDILSQHAPDFLQKLQTMYPDGFPKYPANKFNLAYWSEKCQTEFPRAFEIFPLAKKRGANIFGFFMGLKLFDDQNLLAAEFGNYRLLKKLCDSYYQIESNLDLDKALEYATELGFYYGSAVGNIYKMKIYLKFKQEDQALNACQRALAKNWFDDHYQPIRNYDDSVNNLTDQEQALVSSIVPSFHATETRMAIRY